MRLRCSLQGLERLLDPVQPAARGHELLERCGAGDEQLERFLVALAALVGGRADPLAAHELDLLVVEPVEVDDGVAARAEPGEEHDAPARPHGRKSLGNERGIADGDEHDVRRLARAGRSDRVLRAEGERELTPVGKRIDRQHASARRGRYEDDLEPHLTGAEHDHAVAGTNSALVVHRVEAVGQRLDEDGALRGEILGDLERAVRPVAAFDGKQRVLRVARICVAVDPRPGLPGRRALTDRFDTSHPLVPGIERVGAVRRAGEELANVRGADAARLDADEQVPRAGLRHRQRVEAKVAGAVKARGAHRRGGHRSLSRSSSSR